MKKLRPDSNRFGTLIVLNFLLASCFMICFSQRVQADVVTDGSVGPNQSLSGPDFVIPDTLGTTTGTNLFHSFQKFGITQDQSATFTGPDTIDNVISRVTGGEISNIDGLLRSEVGQADFFFINPSGVVFGENACVDVPAAFHVSTADALNFEDGSVFSASSPDASTLTMATPESFGFLGAQSASIEINGALLEFQPGSHVSLTSGDITIKGTATQDAELVSEAGEIHLTAMGTTTGDVPITENLITDPDGNLVMNSARVETSGNGGGYVLVQAGNVDMDKTMIETNNTGDNVGEGGICFIIEENFSLINESCLNSYVLGDGVSGNIVVNADKMTIDGDANKNITGIINYARTMSKANSGSVEINVDGLLELLNGGIIGTITDSKYGADAGNVRVTAGILKIDGQGSDAVTGIVSQAQSQQGSTTFISESGGNAGSVDVSVAGLIELINLAQISSSTWSLGNSGNITVSAGEMTIDRQEGKSPAGIMSNAYAGSNGRAGSVKLEVDGLLKLINGGQITSSTFAKGDAGSIIVNAGEISIDGCGHDTHLTGISSSAYSESEGNAGEIRISVNGLMELINNGIITSSTWSKGDAGNIIIDANEINIDGYGHNEQVTGISSSAYSKSEGDAGEIRISVNGLMELINDVEISSSTWAKGNAGGVTVNAGELRIDHQGGEGATWILSTTISGSEGNAGIVKIKVEGLMEVINGADISTTTWGKGNGGNVFIEAAELIIDGTGKDSDVGIGSNARLGEDAEGNAGSVNITVNGSLKIINGAQLASSTFANGNAGNIIVNASDLFLDSSYIKGAAFSETGGYVGNISINSDSVTLLNNSKITIAANQTLSTDKIAEMPQRSITINTKNLYLDQSSTISSESTQNVPASEVNIHANNITLKNNSSITTSSNDADGGTITIQTDSVFLNDSLITTSVAGITGSGGDITIQGISKDGGIIPADALAMKGGFIQANTAAAAADASGGNITIIARAVVSDFLYEFQVGGEERQEFQPGQYLNVIQAASEGGESGNINITAPEIDISGSLANVGTYFVKPAQMATNPCVATIGQTTSSLIQGGRGGIPETPNDLSSVSYMGHRLDQIFNEDN